MNRMFTAPTAMLGELNFALNQLLILPAPVVDPVTGFAGQFD
jgi:hypothetical protein